jgi:hypothetical protein
LLWWASRRTVFTVHCGSVPKQKRSLGKEMALRIRTNISDLKKTYYGHAIKRIVDTRFFFKRVIDGCIVTRLFVFLLQVLRLNISDSAVSLPLYN